MKPMHIISVVVLLILYDRLEYAWYLAGESGAQPFYLVKSPWNTLGSFPFVVDFVFRLDDYIYKASVKLKECILPICIWICWPVLRKYSQWMIISFGLCFLEYFLTCGYALYQIPLPLGLTLPVSTAPLKLFSVIWFSVGGIKQIYDPIYH